MLYNFTKNKKGSLKRYETIRKGVVVVREICEEDIHDFQCTVSNTKTRKGGI